MGDPDFLKNTALSQSGKNSVELSGRKAKQTTFAIFIKLNMEFGGVVILGPDPPTAFGNSALGSIDHPRFGSSICRCVDRLL